MNTRVALFVIGLILLSVAVVYLVAVVLPGYGITQAEPALRFRPSQDAGTAPRAPRPPLTVTPPERGPLSRLLLRPFGLHREGLPGLWWYLGSFVSVLVLAIIALFLFPRRVSVLARVISNGWGQRVLAFAVGLLGYLGIGLLIFLIFINVVGWPIAIILVLAVYFATVIGVVAVSLALGAGVCRFFRLEGQGPLLHLAVGIVLLSLVSIIPYLGWIVVGLSAVAGFGAVLWTRGGDVAGWSLDQVVD